MVLKEDCKNSWLIQTVAPGRMVVILILGKTQFCPFKQDLSSTRAEMLPCFARYVYLLPSSGQVHKMGLINTY